MKIQALKCPECVASLEIEEGLEYCFCKYCGCKIMIQDENKQTYRHIDEADVKRAETERIIQIKEMELEEKERNRKKYYIIAWIIAIVVLLFLGVIGEAIESFALSMCFFIAMMVGLYGFIALVGSSDKKKKIQKTVGTDEVIITSNMMGYKDKNFNSVVAMYKGVGFTNVTAVPLNDLNLLSKKKNGQVDEITINGNDFDEDDIFAKNSYVVITYHSM